MRAKHACPCCGHVTLEGRGGYDICPVCFWEDDNQDDIDAHHVRGGPNQGLSLWRARANYLRIGACDEAMKEHVRPPRRRETAVRRWTLLDDVAVERIPGDDVSPWSLLHGGCIVRASRGAVCLSVWVETPYVRARFLESGSAFRLELFDCTLFTFTPREGATIDEPGQIVACDIVEAKSEADHLTISGSAGSLQLRYESLALRFDTGSPLALVALDRVVEQHWDEWSRKSAPSA